MNNLILWQRKILHSCFILLLLNILNTASATNIKTLLHDFESDTEGWAVASNATAVNKISTSVNAPNSPYNGASLLEFTRGAAPGTDWSVISRSYTTPIDMSIAQNLQFALNSYGINPSNTGFTLQVSLTSNNGASVKTVTQAINADSWNLVSVDISSWSGNTSVTKMEVAVKSDTFTSAWGGKHQIDWVALEGDPLLHDFESDTQGWQAESNVSAVNKVSTSVNGPGTPYNGSSMLEFSRGAGLGTDWSEISRDYTTPIDMSTAQYLQFALNSYGINPSNTAFTVQVTLTSNNGASPIMVTEAISADAWNLVSVDIRNWNGNTSVTKIAIAVKSNTFATAWTGKHQIDWVVLDGTASTNDVLIDSVSATDTSINLSGEVTVTSSSTLALYELAPYESFDINASNTALDTITVLPTAGSSTSYSFNNVARFDGTRDRVYSKFAVVVDNQHISTPEYVTTFPVGENDDALPIAKSKKGLQVQTVGDAQDLGISHAAINVPLERIWASAASTLSDDGVTYMNNYAHTTDGETFYFREDEIDGLDQQIKNLSDNDITISLIMIFYIYDRVPASVQGHVWQTMYDALKHPDVVESGDTILSAFNTTNQAGVKYFKASMEFIAKRYSTTDSNGNYINGRAVNFIISNEVNTPAVWNNMGNKSLAEAAAQYARTMRIANTAVKKMQTNGQVFISLDHFWAVTDLAGTYPNQAYAGKALLDEMNAVIKQNGDFDWAIAYHPYPENLFEPRFWRDNPNTTQAHMNANIITFNNIEQLSAYAKLPDLQYQGNDRKIILSEQGFSDADYGSVIVSEADQAAAYAYAYYKIRFTDNIDSLILHRHIDHPGEGGLLLGLWNYRSDSSNYTNLGIPNNKKIMYDVFKNIDTVNSEALTDAESLLSVIQADIPGATWSSLVDNFDANALQNSPERDIPATTTMSAPATLNPTSYVSNFDSGTNNDWVMSEYSDDINVVSSMASLPQTPQAGSHLLELNMDHSGLDLDYGAGHGFSLGKHGITRNFASAIDVSSTPKFQFAINSYGGVPAKIGNFSTTYQITVRILGEDSQGEAVMTEDTSSITPDQWNLRQMDLSSFSGKANISKIKIWFHTDSNQDWSGKFQLDTIGFAQ
jgi:hypothetical protein